MTETLDSIEQENDDDEVIALQPKKPKQRQASSGSVEYVQVINNDQSSISSLNNIENLKLKSPSKDEEIIFCDSSPSIKKNQVKPSINGTHRTNGHQVILSVHRNWNICFFLDTGV